MTPLQSYFSVAVVLGLAAGLAVVMGAAMVLVPPLVTKLLGLTRPNAQKLQPYECGITPPGSGRVRFSIKFYLVAMIFILFDIEAIFLYPWAVLLLPDAATGAPGLGWPGLVTMGIFVATLVAGLAYVWKKGVLDWSH